MKHEDQVWALLALLFVLTPWVVSVLESRPYANLNLMFICLNLSSVLGMAFGVVALIKKSLRAIALLSILIGVFYFVMVALTFVAAASM